MWEVYFSCQNISCQSLMPPARVPPLGFQKFAVQNLFICKHSYPMKYKRFV